MLHSNSGGAFSYHFAQPNAAATLAMKPCADVRRLAKQLQLPPRTMSVKDIRARVAEGGGPKGLTPNQVGLAAAVFQSHTRRCSTLPIPARLILRLVPPETVPLTR